MRVAIHFPDGEVAAYKLGRIEDGVHNINLLTGETADLDASVQDLIKQAKKEFPKCEVVLERMVMDDHDADTSKWVPAEDVDPEVHTFTRAGNQVTAPGLDTSVTAKGA